ncbi:hypothetical protein SAMN05660479_01473 [Microbulbifer thermotolerans]|uniref:hypothetical protein n=1 Tax=Microbulbifer thermotolerans TaxID=252514 RepID=UPI0008E4F111|nr:hypothetical protein [Microbulbifer thermotolerans]SFC31639.1 hypothetical protein SAMN05660479_01473 [Microbulbifer thermotolerans]
MAKGYKQGKRNRGGGQFAAFPHRMVNHPHFAALTPRAKALLFPLVAQYNGHNNGDLCASFSKMRAHGWTSNDQLQKALRELLETGFLILTRQGRRPNVPSLYALSWRPIDECGGKLEVSATVTAPNTWREPKGQFRFSDGRHTA